jgi:hypothetical protein
VAVVFWGSGRCVVRLEDCVFFLNVVGDGWVGDGWIGVVCRCMWIVCTCRI